MSTKFDESFFSPLVDSVDAVEFGHMNGCQSPNYSVEKSMKFWKYFALVQRHVSLNLRKMYLLTCKLIQISLRIRAVWSESSLSAWKTFEPFAIQNAYKEYSDYTAQIRSWNWIIERRICPKVSFLTLRFRYNALGTFFHVVAHLSLCWFREYNDCNWYPVSRRSSEQLDLFTTLSTYMGK